MKTMKKLATLTTLGLLALSTAYTAELDADGDGIADAIEIENGTNPYLSDIPSFEGSFFQDFKITNLFVNDAGERKITEFNPSINPGTHFFETLASLNKSNSKYGRLLIQDSNTYIYSSPTLSELAIHKMSKENDVVAKAGFTPKAITLEFKNSIKFKSSFPRIDSPVYTLFYQDGRHLIEIAKINDRNSYVSGGEAKEVPMKVTVTDPNLLSRLSNFQSRFLVIQITDFYIPQIDKIYSEIQKELDEKTTALTILSGKNIETYHVATTADTALDSILITAIKGNYVLADDELISYKDLSNKTGQNWQVLTPSGENVFAYDYQIGNDNLLLNYSKDEEALKIGKPAFKTVTGKQDDVFLKTNGLREFAFIIDDIYSYGHDQLSSIGTERSCGKKGDVNPHDNKVTYTYLSYSPRTAKVNLDDPDQLNLFLKTQELTVGTKVFNLQDLVSKELISIKMGKTAFFTMKSINLELRTTPEFMKLIASENGHKVSFKLSNKSALQSLSTGKKINSCLCTYRRNMHQDFEYVGYGCTYVKTPTLNTVSLEATHSYNISLITY